MFDEREKMESTHFLSSQATGLVTAFNNTNLRATIFLPKNIAFENLLNNIGMTVDQALSPTSAFAPYLGQVRRLDKAVPRMLCAFFSGCT